MAVGTYFVYRSTLLFIGTFVFLLTSMCVQIKKKSKKYKLFKLEDQKSYQNAVNRCAGSLGQAHNDSEGKSFRAKISIFWTSRKKILRKKWFFPSFSYELVRIYLGKIESEYLSGHKNGGKTYL